jgi:tRNA modification GTPase
MDDADTIAAISSPVGEGGIGIIRMSGPDAHSILKQIFRPRNTMKEHASHHLNLGFIFDPQNNTDIDEVFVVVMNAPATYTREMMAEVYCHGGLAAQRHILEIMLSAGARLAEPGEFTKRAYLNGRIDLTQAESVLDIIESHTEQELHAALAQTKGQLALAIEALRKEIIALLAEVEADIDFPDEDISLSQQMWSSRLANLENEINTLIESYYEGRAITQGLDVVIIGRTNVGKSSLLNALALANKAIVTHIPGTTRDLVEDKVIVKGVKFRITDTAGLRSSIDPIELIGIDRARGRIMEADIIL